MDALGVLLFVAALVLIGYLLARRRRTGGGGTGGTGGTGGNGGGNGEDGIRPHYPRED
jgi:preprotein translocase subunit SecG